ncbi:MAG: secreted PhoX family phosphatase [Myxococcota bacterium]|jgi:secreted PhoX family phosphatase
MTLMMLLLACQGPVGSDGVDGADGTDGEDGLSGTDGEDGEDGEGVTDESLVPTTLRFADIGYPQTEEDRKVVQATTTAWVDEVETTIDYHVLMRSGDEVGGGVLGALIGADGKPLIDTSGAPIVASSLDFSSFIPTDAGIFSVTHIETTPGGLYLTQIDQDETTGLLTATDTQPIDLSDMHGIHVPCAGTVTPWGTHLGGEEYPVNARKWETAETWADTDLYARGFFRYWGHDIETDKDKDRVPDNLDLDAARSDYWPYRYGFAFEVSLDDAGAPTVTRHHSLGRTSVELALVMPDERTVYITDDASNGTLFLYYADAPGDLSAGHLYAMRWHQSDSSGAGAADLEWIPMGHATDAEVSALIEGGIVFSDIFDVANAILEPGDSGLPPILTDECPEGFSAINVDSYGMECLALVEGMELAASRLEADRYAAMLGATTELRKLEGATYDPEHGRVYIAISEIDNGMEAGSPQYDRGGGDHIRLDENVCGAVYALDLVPDSVIGSDHVAQRASGFLVGEPVNYPEDSIYSGNGCSVSAIANPDNIHYIPGVQVLMVAEDTSERPIDMLWAYDLRAGTLDRILTTPYGGENTSIYAYTNLNGWAYIKNVIQHPFGDPRLPGPDDPADRSAYDGYFGPLPALSLE